jgi:diguanylate cyclase (GGDEF)-like protein
LKLNESFADLWTSTGFVSKDLSAYAERLMAVETRAGVINVSLFSLLLLGGAAILYAVLGMGANYAYTYAALAALSLHILRSAKSVTGIRVLYLLGTVLLVIIGVGLVLLAHQSGSLSGSLVAAVALLFMVVPMVPWGLRDAGIVTLLIYGMFTGSTLAVWGRFSGETLWTLQFLMVSAGVVSLLLVMRAVSVRKHHIAARFELEGNERELQRLSEVDPLTGAYNRRALETRLPALLREAHGQGAEVCFAVLDLDHFKRFNDAFGHQRGDGLLCLLRGSFAGVFEPGEIMVRMGGDEFAVVLRGPDARERLERAAGMFLSAAQGLGDRREHAPTLSIGYTRFAPARAIDLSQAYGEADAALYRAKSAGRGRIEEYFPGLGQQRLNRRVRRT